MAYLSQHLATICQTVPLDVNIEDLKIQPMLNANNEPLVPQTNQFHQIPILNVRTV